MAASDERMCEGCGFRKGMSRGKKRAGQRLKFCKYCLCGERPPTLFKKDKCAHCNFIAMHPCQLDVDHIDGNHANNALSNLQTLCANCHRLKTYLNKDWENK